MSDFTFRELIAKRGLDPTEGRLVRHDRTGRGLWERGKADFDHFVNTQRTGSVSPYHKADLAHQFVTWGSTEALYVGSHRIRDRWYAGDLPDRKPRLHKADAPWHELTLDHEAYDLERVAELDDLAGRVKIDWGTGTRSWSQWLRRHDKPILEFRERAGQPSFPGFTEFETLISDVPTLPLAWLELLGSVQGVYILVTPNGSQYVGSAYGAGGFRARWLEYAADGHGGNKLLRERPVFDATVRVLRVMDPSASPSEVVAEEGRWKRVLGTRATALEWGLNAN